jgi:hypothetical protein
LRLGAFDRFRGIERERVTTVSTGGGSFCRKIARPMPRFRCMLLSRFNGWRARSHLSGCAWTHTPWIVPIPGTRNIDHLTENLGAINVELTAADLLEVETEFSKIKVQGERMSEQHMQQIDPAK